MDDAKTKRRLRVAAVRETDLEPYTALRWVGTLFKAAAVFLAVAMAGELVAGVRVEGVSALPTLLGEMARTLVVAVVLWGGGDFARLLIDIGHDIRAERIMLARLAHRLSRGRRPRKQKDKADALEAIESGGGLVERAPGEVEA